MSIVLGGGPRNLRIVLVRPRDPNNIGAAARAMANFGIEDLWIVSPHPPVWREAKSAVGAQGLLRDATEAATIAEAVAGCRAVWATSSLQRRKAEAGIYDLPRWPVGRGAVAVLFGPEKTGLSADDLSYATAILRIPTVKKCPSMNLAASVAVVCYSWAIEKEPSPRPSPAPLARKRGSAVEQRERYWRALEGLAERAGWPAGERRRRLKALAYRTNATDGELGMLLALVRAL